MELNSFTDLVSPQNFHDACGVGFLVNRDGVPTHAVVNRAFTALKNLAHRGAVDADGKTGDGAGILTAIPHGFYRKQAIKRGLHLPQSNDFAVMLIFYPTQPDDLLSCQKIVEATLKRHGFQNLWTRVVPVDRTTLGSKALASCPEIEERFLARPAGLNDDEFEKRLHFLRKELDILVTDGSFQEFYVASVSCRNITHKGLFVGEGVREFYLDLKDADFVSPYVIFHQRYSTNTFPKWALAHPFRMIAHNGEINTIRANRNWMEARSIADQPRSWVPAEHTYSRVILAKRSDSASLDNMLEAYVHAGRSVLHAMAHMLPEAWQKQPHLGYDLRAFYEYHACLSEPWDGPAAVVFCDGKFVGAMLDRNGLRPLRYKITDTEFFGCSEVGCIPYDASQVLESGKLSPGQMIAFDLTKKIILKNDAIKSSLARQKPYAEWVGSSIVPVERLLSEQSTRRDVEPETLDEEEYQKLLKNFAYTQEDMERVLLPLCVEGQMAVGSMGDDTPLACLSGRAQLFYNYFKQMFAQVTNPPIDPLREETVMSLWMYLGQSGNVFEETPTHAKQIRLTSPFLNAAAYEAIVSHADFPSAVLDAVFPVVEGPSVLEDVLVDLCQAAEKAVRLHKKIIVLSDRLVSAEYAAIPMLLAVSAVHQHLIKTGLRLNISLVVKTGEAREAHHHACLIGFGASAIYPYLALNVARKIAVDKGLAANVGVANYIHGCEKGLYKVLSKMGISTLQSYHAAQLFEVIGLKASLIHTHFTGAIYRLSGGVDLRQIAGDVLDFHSRAFAPTPAVLDAGGQYRYRREGEYHANNPQMVMALHKAVSKNDPEAFHQYSKLIHERAPTTLRDLWQLKAGVPVTLDEVESANELVKRFCTPGISYGAISKEVHEDFAIAMNRLKAKSDSGEGGEDPERYTLLPNGDSKNSAIKQVASGRFGVTAYYLSQASEIEIKIAQGAKPGEGGQLPGHKVSVEIARVRHATPGVTLISPPPHHDIYSIEDLSQLIYDLKRANPKARVCVKLVSEAGIGTIAAGVAKAHADVILISGHDGGTGAATLESIRHAGLPWELGLTEVQQALVNNGLRGHVRLRVDGGIKTGLDVIKAALLGAEEFGFGTTAMVAAGCKMVRVCHLNTCPVGVATQDPELRKKYVGTPERIVNFFIFVAVEVRQWLAGLGFKKLEDCVGRADLLEQIHFGGNQRLARINLSPLTAYDVPEGVAVRQVRERNDWQGDQRFDETVFEDVKPVLESGCGQIVVSRPVANTHRSVGARLSYEVVSRHGPQGLPKGQIDLELSGTAGQSLGAFLARTIHIHLTGEANDYVGKGLSGGMISIKPPATFKMPPEQNVICGNTCLYGATSGALFINGLAGERFAVRNSGAEAVVEGIGDHGCEYMTGGFVVILGPVGYNFGAGMTGGVACVYDPEGDLKNRVNQKDVRLALLTVGSPEAERVHFLLQEHARLTGSALARRHLADWPSFCGRYGLVLPA